MDATNLYTFHVDFRDNLYVNQTHAETPVNAPYEWAKRINTKQVKYFGDYTKSELIANLEEDINEGMVIFMDNSVNMFGFSYLIKTGVGLVDFIKTDNSETESIDNLYTFIMYFDGTTYFYQHHALNEYKAIGIWAAGLNIKEIRNVGEKAKQKLIQEIPQLIADNKIKPVENLINVWKFDYQFRTGNAVLHIVKTAKD